MQRTKSSPETEGSSADPAAAADPTPVSLSQADLALVAAIVAPLAIIGLLVLIGVGVGAALCITFVSAVALTTTLDVERFLRRRRLRSDPSRTRS